MLEGHRLSNPGIAKEHVFYGPRIDVDAGNVDGVIGAGQEMQLALLVELAQIPAVNALPGGLNRDQDFIRLPWGAPGLH